MNRCSSIIAADYSLAAASEKDSRCQVVTTMVSELMEKMLANSQWSSTTITQAGIVVGSRFGRMEFIDKAGRQASRLGLKDYCNPKYFVHSVSSAIPGQAAVDNRVGTETISVNTAELSGLDAIGYAHCAVLASGDLYFAGGADSACAIRASGKFPDSAGVRDGVALLAICPEDSEGQPPLARILDYASLLLPPATHAFEDHLQQSLAGLRRDHPSTLLITFGAVAPRRSWLERQYPFVADHIHVEDLIGITGGAAGAMAPAMLLSGEHLFAASGLRARPMPVIVAGVSSKNKYAHLLIQLNKETWQL